ncbi:hypothetical protein [Cellulomonas sp. ES6]|uniref:hypothetical protein n=1 Tax=Cellulomonas sp. ES6 TaxID=3039384 RepID=UPI0024B703D3|nr:hypothetical protein [Cellulomonas sp. ES6]WHP18804.1 hypothetical protein P9841_06725 [Cellulomonas sp. ES6]
MSVVNVTPYGRPQDNLDLDDARFGNGGGLAYLRDTAVALLAQGHDDERRSTYTEFSEVHPSHLGVLSIVQGGEYGESRTLVDRVTKARRAITVDDAVLSDARVVLVVPEHGQDAVMVSEVKGRTHHTAGFVTRVNTRLKGDGLSLRLRREVADGVAWGKFLADQDAGIVGVEFAQSVRRSEDRTPFATGGGLTAARLRFALSSTGDVAQGIIGRLRGASPEQSLRDQLDLATVVGLRDYHDEDFDEQRIIVVKDGRERTINVSQALPSFTYVFADDERPDHQGFLDQSRGAVLDLFQELGVELPPQWWPEAPTT